MLWPRLCFQVLGSRCSWLPAGPAYLLQDWGWGDPAGFYRQTPPEISPGPGGPGLPWSAMKGGEEQKGALESPWLFLPPVPVLSLPLVLSLTRCLLSLSPA